MPRVAYTGVGLPPAEYPHAADVEFDVVVRGEDGDIVEKTAVEARDAGVRALEAFATGEHPDDCQGTPIGIDWDGVLAGDYDDDGGDADV